MRRVILVGVFAVAVSCGGGSSPTAPTPTPQPAANQNPSITSMNVTAFGIQQLSTFSFSASASDPNGDALTYAWSIAGNAAAGTSGTMTFTSGGNGVATLTVSDGKGGTATDTRAFVVGSLTGRWNGTWETFVFTSNLVQNNGGIITGDYVDQVGSGILDPAEVHTINANGQVRLRYKGGPWTDFIFTGQMDSTGRRVTGTVSGQGYNSTFTMTK